MLTDHNKQLWKTKLLVIKIFLRKLLKAKEDNVNVPYSRKEQQFQNSQMAKAVQDCPFRIYRGELRRLEKGLERNKNIK